MNRREIIIETLKQCFDGFMTDFDIYLFGSWAYGQPNRHSDIDILVETDTDYNEMQRKAIVYSVLRRLQQKNVELGTFDISVINKHKHIQYVKDRFHLLPKIN